MAGGASGQLVRGIGSGPASVVSTGAEALDSGAALSLAVPSVVGSAVGVTGVTEGCGVTVGVTWGGATGVGVTLVVDAVGVTVVGDGATGGLLGTVGVTVGVTLGATLGSAGAVLVAAGGTGLSVVPQLSSALAMTSVPTKKGYRDVCMDDSKGSGSIYHRSRVTRSGPWSWAANGVSECVPRLALKSSLAAELHAGSNRSAFCR